MVLFGIGADRIQECTDRFRDTIVGEETDLPTIDVSETVTLDAVYRFLRRERTTAGGIRSGGG